MPSTPLLGLALPVQGTLSGTWGTTVNDAITSLVEQAIAETVTISTDADKLLTTTTEASNEARRAIILWTAGGTTTRNITAPAASKTYIVINATSSTQSIVFKASATTGVTIVAGEKCVVAWNGSDFVKISSTTGNASVTTVGNSFYTLTNPGAITFPRINANNTVTARSAADFRSDIGAGDVNGPASSTDNAFTRFDGTGGKTVQNSTGATLTDAGAATFTGSVDIAGTSAAGANIKLYEDTDNGTNYVAFKSPDTLSGNITWTLPTADGTNGQVLQTNGSGSLSWLTLSSGIPYPGAGIPVSTGSAWNTSLSVPTGDLVGTSATQTLTNKTLTSPTINSPTIASPTINDGYTEEIYAVVDAAGVALSPTNGSIQTWTLGASRTPTAGTWANGQSMTLMIDDGSAYTVTWTTIGVTWKTNAGSAPTLNTSGYTVIQLWKVGNTVYGARVGDA